MNADSEDKTVMHSYACNGSVIWFEFDNVPDKDSWISSVELIKEHNQKANQENTSEDEKTKSHRDVLRLVRTLIDQFCVEQAPPDLRAMSVQATDFLGESPLQFPPLESTRANLLQQVLRHADGKTQVFHMD